MMGRRGAEAQRRTHKPTTLREAIAEATVTVSKPETIAAVREHRVPKGDVIEAARIAGLFGIKRTADMIPDCHPLPVEHAEVTSNVQDMAIVITVKVRTIYRTGVEVEAMHGASVAALTMYDMLKPIDKGITIDRIRLVQKKGGKSDWKDQFEKMPRAAVLVISDSVSAGKKEDKAGKAIGEKLKSIGVELSANALVPDEPEHIAAQVKAWADQGIDLILTTGGTGLSPRDRTPEAIAPILDREVPGIMEAARSYGDDEPRHRRHDRPHAGDHPAGVNTRSARDDGCALPFRTACGEGAGDVVSARGVRLHCQGAKNAMAMNQH